MSGWSRSTPCNVIRTVLQNLVLLPTVRAYCAPFKTSSECHELNNLSGPLVIVANHASHLDTPAILAALPSGIRHHTAVAAAADYFYRNPLLGAAVSVGIGTFPFPRAGRAGTDRAAQLLSEGQSVLLFPQGSRAGDRFRAGVGYLLAETGASALPVGLSGCHEVWPRGRALPRRGCVHVRIGRPWKPETGMAPRAVVEELERQVAALTNAPEVLG